MPKEKIISVMKRYELKYFLNKEQLTYFMDEVKKHMKIDKYGQTTISSIYFDTPDFRLITKSIEKPKYKEKIRLRSYSLAKSNTPTFLEIKRKCEGIVYKRRISLLEKDAYNFIKNKEGNNKEQITREIEAFLDNFDLLEPKYIIIYDRVALYQENSDLRITIDKNPRYRINDLNLHTSLDGIPLLDKDNAILEVKVQHSVPMWLVEILSKGKIYQTSFSKVGTAHKKELLKKNKPLLNINYKGEMQYGFSI